MIDFIRPQAKVLEVGCATGYVTRELKNKGCEVICIEIDQALAERAKIFSQEMIIGDIEDPAVLKKLDKKFDYILFMDVLEHLKNPRTVVSAVRAYLNETGVIIANIPNIAFYQNRLEILKGRFEYTDFGFFDAGHLRFYNYKTARELLEGAGCRIEKCIPFTYFPGEFWLEKIPLLGKLLLKITSFIKNKFPNLYGFSFMYWCRKV